MGEGERLVSRRPGKILISKVAFLKIKSLLKAQHVHALFSLFLGELGLTPVQNFYLNTEEFCGDRKSISKPTQLYMASITTEADTQILMVPVKHKLNFAKQN